ncbi:hypothetical protein [Paenibacillus humicola]|uniref:hypothetical protein n=1 Tax=Paenibacillus humicola TaxID=3110540 RepID=UPI00237A876E|nr:hypothetical protein [Paenibacillus humicola]
MNRDLRIGTIGLAFVQGLAELLMFLPLAMMISAYFLHDAGDWLWLAPALAGYPAGRALNGLLRFRHPFPVALAALIVGALTGWLLFGLSRAGAASALAVWIACYRGGMTAVTPWSRRFMTRHYIVGLAVYFLVSGIFGRMAPMRPLQLPLIGFGIAALLLSLFALNRGFVNDEALSADDKPRIEPTVRKHNRLLVAVITGIAVLIVLSYQLQAIFGALWEQVRGWLNRLLTFSPPKSPQQTQEPALPQQPALPPGSGKHLPHWVDWLTYGLTILVVLAALWLLLRKLRSLPEWLNRLRARLAAMFGRDKNRPDQGYTDEVENLRKPPLIDRFRRSIGWEKRERWKDLHDNESRLRYLYRLGVGRTVKSGYAFKPYLTPEELREDARAAGKGDPLPEELVRQYNSVRYGAKKVTDEQLNAYSSVKLEPKKR